MRKFLQSASLSAIAGAMMLPGGVAQAQEDIIVVRGAFVPDEKRATSEISSLLDSEDFQRTGDSDIASALLRVTGLSITDGKFPVARGLNERYSSATLNGVPLPSPEPLRRAVPLDIIPTNILSGSLVQKTFSPEFSGEFGGAAIDLRTLSIPSENFLKLTIGGEIDTETSFRTGYFTDGSDTDRLGFDDGLREIPDLALAEFQAGSNDLSPEAAASFEHLDSLIVNSDETPMNGSGSISFGRVLVDNVDYTIGTVASVSYSNSHQNRDGFEVRTFDRGDGNTDPFDPQEIRQNDFVETRQNIELNAFTSTGIEFGGGDHKIAYTGILLRNTLDRVQIGDRINATEAAEDFVVRQEAIDYIERQLWQAQLTGEHLFPNLSDLEFAWAASYGEATRDSYERRTSFLPTQACFGEEQTFRADPTTGCAADPTAVVQDAFAVDISQSGRTTIGFTELKDENTFARGDFTLPFELGATPITLKFGGSYSDASRDNNVRNFNIEPGRDFSDFADLTLLRPDLLFADEIFLGTEALEIEPQDFALQPSATEASLEIYAGYLTGEVELSEFLKFSVGARFEDSTQETATFQESLGPDSGVAEILEEDYVLPAASITWNPVSSLQVRFAASETITRPQFRELAGNIFIDPDLNLQLQGNPLLENSEILNIDGRAEYYFARGQFFTFGAFYKEVDNVIERFFSPAQDAERFIFVNSGDAEIYGFEAEYERRFDLGFNNPSGFFGNKELVLISNYTYTQSEVETFDQITFLSQSGNPTTQTNSSIEGHRLQGQSDHLFNLQLGLENVDTGSKATLLFNYASERTLAVGTSEAGEPANEVLENPPVSVDLVIRQNLDGQFKYSEGMELGISVKNILGDDFDSFREFINGEETVEAPFLEYDRGTLFSVSLSKEF